MYKIIGGDQKEYGPIAAEQLRQWIAERRLNAESLVLPAGASEWKKLGTLPEFAATFLAGGNPPPPTLGLAGGSKSAGFSAEVLARAPDLDIGQCLAQSWKLFAANMGLFCGATVSVWAIATACQLVPVAGIVYVVLKGMLFGGVYLVILDRIRGQQSSVGRCFDGFRINPAQLLLVGVLTYILTSIGVVCCLIIPGVYLAVAWAFSVPLVADQKLEAWSAMELSRKVVTRVWFRILALQLLAFLPFIVTFLAVQAKMVVNMAPFLSDLFKSSQPDYSSLSHSIKEIASQNLGLLVVLRLVLLFNLPFALGALMYAYEGLFAPRTTSTT